MLQEGTHLKKRKLAQAETRSFGAATMPPPTAKPAPPPPPPAPVATQREPPMPSFMREALDGLKELFGFIIGHLEKMANKLSNIDLCVERLEHTVAPQLPPHPSVPLDLKTQTDEDKDNDE